MNMEEKMKKISGSTFMFKKLIPGIVFVFLGFGIIAPFIPGSEKIPITLLIAPILMGCAAFIFFKKTVWDLADVVYDNGDELIFIKGNKKQSVSFKEIINISYPSFNSPQRIEVSVRNIGPIGKDLVFRPPMHYNFFVKDPFIIDLVERVDRAKNLNHNKEERRVQER